MRRLLAFLLACLGLAMLYGYWLYRTMVFKWVKVEPIK